MSKCKSNIVVLFGIETREEEYELRKGLVEKALAALTTEVDGQTIFE